METQYNRMFEREDFKLEAIMAVRVAIKSGLFKKENSIEHKRNVIEILHKDLCRIYEIPELPIKYIEGFYSVGQFNTREIILSNNSLVTYLHEFCHYLQHKLNKPNTEEIARGWSISLYFIATPKLCRSAIEKGLIIHQKVFEGD